MFLKELESWLERGQNVPFLREICPRKKCTPSIGTNIGAITRILLREDPLSTGVLDVFFLKISDHPSLCKTEILYLKFHQIYNSFNSNDPS
jgi:hypothetical protein